MIFLSSRSAGLLDCNSLIKGFNLLCQVSLPNSFVHVTLIVMQCCTQEFNMPDSLVRSQSLTLEFFYKNFNDNVHNKRSSVNDTGAYCQVSELKPEESYRNLDLTEQKEIKVTFTF